jgi:hypothetical protein
MRSRTNTYMVTRGAVAATALGVSMLTAAHYASGADITVGPGTTAYTFTSTDADSYTYNSSTEAFTYTFEPYRYNAGATDPNLVYSGTQLQDDSGQSVQVNDISS